MSRISNSFIWRQQILENESLSSTTKLVAMILHFHMDNDSCECFPSEATIAKEASLTERCVVKHIKILKNTSQVRIRKEKGGQGWNRNVYRGLIKYSKEVEDEYKTEGNEFKGIKDVNEIHTNSSNNSSYNSIKISNEFNSFWDKYPEEKRYNKSQCLKLWNEKSLDLISKDIISGLISSLNCEQWKSGYIPSISKFIEEEQWQKVFKSTAKIKGRVL